MSKDIYLTNEISIDVFWKTPIKYVLSGLTYGLQEVNLQLNP